jgi:hypothetical protein
MTTLGRIMKDFVMPDRGATNQLPWHDLIGGAGTKREFARRQPWVSGTAG